MLIPPESHAGWKVWTLGDDIAWLHLDDQGQLRAINPEAGYFGVVPGTNESTNRNAFQMIHRDTIFTNVAVTADNQPWWEDKQSGEPRYRLEGPSIHRRQRTGGAPPIRDSPYRRRRMQRTPSSPRHLTVCRSRRSFLAAAVAS